LVAPPPGPGGGGNGPEADPGRGKDGLPRSGLPVTQPRVGVGVLPGGNGPLGKSSEKRSNSHGGDSVGVRGEG